MSALENYSLREDIVAYWSERAQTFDQSFAHGMATEDERAAWASLIGRAVGPAPREVLELACGTGEITRVLLGLGYAVTALDFAEPMLERARAKLVGQDRLRLRLGDAEHCLEPDGRYDAVISRHLVWTLLAPAETFRDWFRVLKPGGTLVILDGNWSEPTGWGRIAMRLARWLDRRRAVAPLLSQEMLERHGAIMRRLPFSAGLNESGLVAMLEAAGFTEITRLSRRAVTQSQRRAGTLADALRLSGQRHIYLSARRPDAPSR